MAREELSRKPGYWAVLPAKVRYDEDLRPNAKLVYAEITALADSTGYCWATNKYLSEMFGLAKKTVSDLISTLEKKGYIRVEVVRDKKGAVSDRKIYVDKVDVVSKDPIPKNGDTYPQKWGYPIPKNAEENNININNNPPIPPKGDGVCVSEPKHKPERFSKLWDFYPHTKRGSKQRAMRAWDKLKPTDELIDSIAKALLRQLRTDEWSRGIGVPHLSSYLNGRLWLDAEDIDETEPAFETDTVEVLPLWT